MLKEHIRSRGSAEHLLELLEENRNLVLGLVAEHIVGVDLMVQKLQQTQRMG